VSEKKKRAKYHLRKGGGRGKKRDKSTERCGVHDEE